MKKIEAIQDFLSYVGNRHLADLYTPEMEVQVNVAQGNGKKTGGSYKGKRWTGWTDGVEVWKSFRIPWNAKESPIYTDSELKFSLGSHLQGIGLTGWDWINRKSKWIGFDFDSIANHKEGLTPEELEEIKEAVFEVPWVTLIRSTSGKGFHIYVHLENPVSTKNHTEHAALARAVLGTLSIETGRNLSAEVDACGSVLWIYHKKQEGTNGLELIKQGEKLSKIPKNWQAHIEVTSRRRKKVKGPTKQNLSFEELTGSVKETELDAEHRKLLQWFSKNGERDFWWDSDHNMLVCHTWDLKKAHKQLELKGIFDTNSTGTSMQNCYAFPVSNGAWIVRRHSLRVNEHPCWSTDPTGWTRCDYNTLPQYETCCRSNKGIENVKGEYVFQTCTEGMEALNQMGVIVSVPELMRNRSMYLNEKGSKLIISVGRETSDTHLEGFLSNKKGDRWEKVVKKPVRKREVYSPDGLVRHVIANNSEVGWWIYTAKQWVNQSRSNVCTVLLALDGTISRNDVDLMLSKSILNPWELVNIPFDEEYPGNRKWNKDAARLACKPTEGDCQTCLNIISHVGKNLDEAVKENSWCVSNAITSGADYLLCWVASLFQQPFEPLPYLFFCGAQETGKSTLHEALSMLMSKGYARADNALVNQSGFNSEIAQAILCVVEEIYLTRNKEAANRIKDWVTGQTISINTKYRTVYDIRNNTHWMQCANDYSFCPIFPGDTRVVVVRVDKPEKEIPKGELFARLEDEKAAFLNLLLSIELPRPEGRLAIPCLHTLEKVALEDANSSPIQLFIKEKIKVCSGHLIAFDVFYDEFISWLSPLERSEWSKNKLARHFGTTHPICKGKLGTKNETFIANAVSKESEVDPMVYEYYRDQTGRLKRRVSDD